MIRNPRDHLWRSARKLDRGRFPVIAEGCQSPPPPREVLMRQAPSASPVTKRRNGAAAQPRVHGQGQPEKPPTSRAAAILGAAIRAMGGTGALREAPTQASTVAPQRAGSMPLTNTKPRPLQLTPRGPLLRQLEILRQGGGIPEHQGCGSAAIATARHNSTGSDRITAPLPGSDRGRTTPALLGLLRRPSERR